MIFEWIEQYSQFANPKHWNWLTFNFAKLEFEWERQLGELRIDVVILGLGFYWSWNYDPETELRKELDAAMEKFNDRIQR